MATPAATPPTPPKVRQVPDFTLRLLEDIEELPPEAPRTRAVNVPEVMTNLLALQSHPNVWAEVAHYKAKPGSDENPSGAKKTVMKFLDGTLKPPPAGEDGGEYDIEWRSADWNAPGRDGTVVLAKYVVSG